MFGHFNLLSFIWQNTSWNCSVNTFYAVGYNTPPTHHHHPCTTPCMHPLHACTHPCTARLAHQPKFQSLPTSKYGLATHYTAAKSIWIRMKNYLSKLEGANTNKIREGRKWSKSQKPMSLTSTIIAAVVHVKNKGCHCKTAVSNRGSFHSVYDGSVRL